MRLQVNAEHCMHVGKLPKETLGKEVPERIRGTIPRGHTTSGVIPLNISQGDKLYGAQNRVDYLEGFFKISTKAKLAIR